MPTNDDELLEFAEHGAPPLPVADLQDRIEREGASIWFASFGDGPPVILLHGGLGHSGNWSKQVPVLVNAGYRVVVIDSRGHGRSTRDGRAYTYERMAADALAVMDLLRLGKAAVVGWSDGACTAMIMGMQAPERVAGVFFFACNMDPSGTKALDFSNPLLGRCYGRHVKDYASLSSTPNDFEDFSNAVSQMMESEPNYDAATLAKVAVPVAIVLGENDEFIKREHARYLHETIPGSDFIGLKGVSHFAPLQRPDLFNRTVLEFLERVLPI